MLTLQLNEFDLKISNNTYFLIAKLVNNWTRVGYTKEEGLLTNIMFQNIVIVDSYLK